MARKKTLRENPPMPQADPAFVITSAGQAVSSDPITPANLPHRTAGPFRPRLERLVIAARRAALPAAIVTCFYLFIYMVINQGIFSHNDFDSYVLQAQAWWQGRAWLDRDYPWLELAIWKGRWRVSFPPVPTLPHFLLYPLAGTNTPNNLLCTLYGILAGVTVWRFLKVRHGSQAMWLAVLAVFGSNMLVLSVWGGVWFQAQLLGQLFCLLAFFLVVDGRRPLTRHLGWLCLALAVGCRPFSIIWFPLLFWLQASQAGASGETVQTAGLLAVTPGVDAGSRTVQTTSGPEDSASPVPEGKATPHTASESAPTSPMPPANLRRRLVSCLPYLILPLAVGAVLGWYNWGRFGNPLEFGHNYLPEFVRSPEGQFAWSYVWPNLQNAFRLPGITPQGSLDFPRSDGSLFFLTNPVFLIFFGALALSFRKKPLLTLTFLAFFVLHALLILAHKTMGGWHFGNRYFADLIPLVVLAFRLLDWKPGLPTRVLAVFGLAINLYGVLVMLKDWV